MKELLIIDDSTTNKISYYHLACFLIALPFDFFYSQLVMISFAAHTCINLKKQYLRLLKSKQTLIPIAIYALGLITISYSTNKAEGLNIAGRQTAIFFMPVLLALNQLNLHKYKTALLKTFAITCTAVIVYLYFDAIHTIVFFHLPFSSLFSKAFINHNFALPIELHATYLSMYAAFSLFIFLFALYHESKWSKKIFYICCIIILFASMLQLTSRAVFAAIAVVVLIGIPVFLTGPQRRIAAFIICGITALSTFFIITKVEAFKTRYISELKNDLTQTPIDNELLEPRIARWKLAFTLVKQSPVIGYGNGSEKQLLKDQYFKNKLYISYLKEFNVHSQYLSFLIKAGILGLALYLFVLYFGLATAIQKKDFIFFVFMVLIAVVSFSENILDVNKGIFFYSFFLSFLLQANSAALIHKGNPNTD